MKPRWLNFLRRVVPGDQPIHPIDKKLAQQWIKKRLAFVFPELRNDAKGLSAAYEQLGLQPAESQNQSEEVPTFEMSLPDVEKELR